MKPNQIIALLVLYVGYLGYQIYDFYDSPQSDLGLANSEQQGVQAQIVEKEKQVKEAQEFYRTLDVKRAELRLLSEKLLSMKASMSESVDIPSFMKLLITEAQRIGLQITSIVPLEEQKLTYYAEQPVEIQFAGVFIQLIAYLDRLSTSSRLIRVEDIALKPASATAKPTGKYTDIVGTIRVKTYYYLVTKDDALGTGAEGAQSTAAPGAPQ